MTSRQWWFSPYSTGGKGALISVSGTAWSSVGGNYVVTNANAFATTPSYFTNGSGGTVILTFDTPQKLTGLRGFGSTLSSRGEWVVEGSEKRVCMVFGIRPISFFCSAKIPRNNLNPSLKRFLEVAYGYYRLGRRVPGSNGPYSFAFLNIAGASPAAIFSQRERS